MNVVIYAKFLSDNFPLLVEYETEEYEDTYKSEVLILSVRLIRKVVNGGQIYARPDGTRRIGPIYEAAWLHGRPGVEFLLTPRQLVQIAELTEKAIKGPHLSVPEESIVYVEV
jgi:hypothetical protein